MSRALIDCTDTRRVHDCRNAFRIAKFGTEYKEIPYNISHPCHDLKVLDFNTEWSDEIVPTDWTDIRNVVNYDLPATVMKVYGIPNHDDHAAEQWNTPDYLIQ
jgi:hypothetical protein